MGWLSGWATRWVVVAKRPRLQVACKFIERGGQVGGKDAQENVGVAKWVGALFWLGEL